MPQLTFDFPATFFSALRKSLSESAAEMRLAAAIHWYDQGMVSEGTAAEIAGLARGARSHRALSCRDRWSLHLSCLDALFRPCTKLRLQSGIPGRCD
jgi:hypothetical protein